MHSAAWMKPLTSLVMALLLGPSVGASPSREEFVIEALRESEEITGIQETALASPSSQPVGNRISHSEQADRGGSGSGQLVWPGVLRPNNSQ